MRGVGIDMVEEVANGAGLNVKPIKKKFSKSMRALIGAADQEDSPRARALAHVMDESGREIFFRPDDLQAALRRECLSETDVFKICLIAQVDGFREILLGDGTTAQLDLDRFIRNAATTTGLSRDTLIALTRDCCYALGLDYCATTPSENATEEDADSVYVFPASVYERDLGEINARVSSAIAAKEPMRTEDLDKLIQLSKIGIPRAKYQLGIYLYILSDVDMEQDQLEDYKRYIGDPAIEANIDLGLRLLSEAAKDGDPNAAAVMGDYHYLRDKRRDWNNAFAYYTGYGSLALTEQRRSRIVSILNRRKFNKRVVTNCVGIFLLVLLSVITAPAATLFRRGLVAGILCLVIDGGILGHVLVEYRKNPYTNFDRLPFKMFCVWAVYMFIRLM
jgi:hypothetical protein